MRIFTSNLRLRGFMKMIDQELKRNKTLKKVSKLALFSKALLLTVTPLLLLAEVSFGSLSHMRDPFLLESIILSCYLILLLSLLVDGRAVIKFNEKIVAILLKRVSQVLAIIILSIIFIFNIGGGLLWGRRSAKAKHPHLVRWYKRVSSGSRSSWESIKTPLILENENSKPLINLFSYFYKNTSLYLLILLIAIFLLSIILIFINSSYIAPFIYTIV